MPRFLQSWFFWSLLAVLLLGVPGIVLLIIHLSGNQSLVNGWLREQIGLSFSFPLSFVAGLILLLLPIILLLLYFLKLKRAPLVVPSTWLWRKTIEDSQVNSFFQWLRRNLLLILQLAVLFSLLYALLAPRLFGDIGSGRHYILLIDNSASMSATDVKPSRLDLAKTQAINEIEARTDNDYGMVIVFNSRAKVLQSYTNDRQRLKSAIESIHSTARPTRIDEALLQADGQANPLRTTDDAAASPIGAEPGKERTYVAAEGIPTEVHLFSDGGFPDVPDFSLGKLNLHYHAVGNQQPSSKGNVGIVSLSAERSEDDPELLEVFGRVHNYGNEPVNLSIRLETRIDNVPQVREAKPNGNGIVPGRTRRAGEGIFSFTLPNVREEANVILNLTIQGTTDDFPTDDQAWLVVGVVRKAKILIVGNGNPFLDSFFNQAEQQQLANVQRLTPTDLEDDDKYVRPAQEGQWDLVIFDRCTPVSVEDLPLANAFFIDAMPPPWDRSKMPNLNNPRIRGWAVRHPLMQDLTGLQDIVIREAFHFNLEGDNAPGGVPRLLEIDQQRAILFPLVHRGFTHLIMTFPLINDQGQWMSSWPFKLSFPLFLRNVLLTLGNVEGSSTLEPGEVKALRADAEIEKVSVIDPQGRETNLQRGSRNDFLYEKTETPGVYRVQWQGQPQSAFSVNLLNAQESDLTPRPSIGIGAEKVADSQPRQQAYDLWKYLAVLGVGLLLAEWLFYNRRYWF